MLNIPEFTVSEFSSVMKRVVEDAFGYVRIKGEIVGFKKATSGHLYFNLKHEDSSLSAICFKNMADAIAFEVADGLQVVASGKVTTYGGRSSYQIVVEKVEIAGIGAILEMIEKRRKKLEAEGLFEQIHKKPIPFFPKKIGIITSKTGAVIQDIINRVTNRCPAHLILYPSATQGKDVVADVIKAIKYFNKLKKEDRPEVLIIARGGGSFEDLLPFNDEEIVRAVFNSEIPIISAVGHETDTTLIDFVADLRAPTPTAAAELATPILAELKSNIENKTQKLENLQKRFFENKAQQLKNLEKYIVDPRILLARIEENLAKRTEKMQIFSKNIFEKKSAKLTSLVISDKIILYKINSDSQKILYFSKHLKSRFENILKNSETKLENFAKLLKSNNYHEILKRGFAVIKDKNSHLITALSNIKAKSEIVVELSDGEFSAYVLENKNKEEKPIKKTEEIQQKLF